MKTISTYYKNQAEFAEFVRQHQQMLFSQENTSVLVQVFCGRNDPGYIKQLLVVISAELPVAYIIGATTAGAIINGEVCGQETVLVISAFQHTTIRIGNFHNEGQGDFVLGRHIAATLGSDMANVVLLFGAGKETTPDQVLKGIEMENPQLLVAGGRAGNSGKVNSELVFYNHGIIDHGFVGVVLEGTVLKVRSYSHLGWQPIGKEMTITKVKGNRVYTINSIPAYQIYRRYLGIDKSCNFLNTIEFPLIVNHNGFLMARTPMIYYEDDSIGFAGELSQGDSVRLSFGDAGLILEMIEQLCLKILQEDVETIFIYSCESRRGFLQELSSIETAPLQNIAPTSGFFTFGEYYHADGKNYLLNATMTVLLLTERDETQREIEQKDYSCLAPVCLSHADKVVERSRGVLKALTHLINIVTAELEVANHNLHYIGLHDSLTGIYNRTFFDQEMERLGKIDETVGIIICDMDYLKLINDTLGHEFGDKIIKLLVATLQEACRKEDVIARIGGDEFAILVTGVVDLATVCARIDAVIQTARAQDETHLLYLSMGFAQRTKGSEQSLNEIFTAADKAMYQSKFEQKKMVRDAIMRGFAQLDCKVIDNRT